jgi:RNA polymerase sigma-70 factor (ECF subfamily)
VKGFEKHWIDFLEGDNHALGEMYVAVFEPLVVRAIYYTRDIENARDIVSQLFAELLLAPKEVRRDRWSQVRDPKSFLSIIVRNKCMDHLRVVSNRQRILKTIPQNHASFYEDSSEKELFVKLNQCISELSDEEQKLLELHLDGYRNHVIAEELNLSEKTVRNKLSLTRKLLVVRWQKLFIFIWLLWN